MNSLLLTSAMERITVAGAKVFPVMADAAWKGAVLLAVAGLVTAALPRAAAAFRHGVWFVSLCGLLLLPVVSALLPGWRVTMGATKINRSPAVVPTTPVRVGPIVSTDSVEIPLPATPILYPPPVRPDWRAWAGVVWLAGAFVALARFAAGLFAAWRLARRGRLNTDPPWAAALDAAAREVGLSRRVRLVFGEPAAMPVTLGLFRPAVLLPGDADIWPADRRRVVLLHELAHVRRRDCLTQQLARFACGIHWFNPLSWHAARRLRAEQEGACDDWVLSRGTKPSDYADHLLAVARSLAGWGGTAAVAMARPSHLGRRLMVILDPRRTHRPPGRVATAAVAAAFLVACVPLGMLRVTRGADNADRPAESGNPPKALSRATTQPFSLLALSDKARVSGMLHAEMTLVQAELQSLHSQLDGAEKDLQASKAKGQNPTPEEWSRVDLTMEERVKRREEWKQRIDSLRIQLGPQHRSVLAAQEELKVLEQQIDAQSQELNRKYLIRRGENGVDWKMGRLDITQLRDEAQRLTTRRNAIAQLLAEIPPDSPATKTPAGTDDPILTARRLELLKLESTLRDAEENLATAEYEVQHAQSQTPEDFARVDETTRDLIRRREEVRRAKSILAKTHLPTHPEMQMAEEEYEQAEKQAAKRVYDLRQQFIVRWREDGPPVLFPKDLGALRAKVDRLKDRLQEEQKRIEEMGRH